MKLVSLAGEGKDSADHGARRAGLENESGKCAVAGAVVEAIASTTSTASKTFKAFKGG